MDQKTYVSGFHDDTAVIKVTYNQLGNTGMSVSSLSLGASSFGSVFRDTDDGESLQVLDLAVRSGINLIDTAPWYGHGKSETVLGKGLANIPRSAYYLTTKVGRYLPDPMEMFDFRAERVIRSVDESLQRLGLNYVDVIQVHDMEFAPNLDLIINETLPALQKVKDAGKAKFIGITGYPLENFKTVLTRSQVKIDTILTYCRGCMNDNALQEYMHFFNEQGVGVINASAISMGLLSNRGPPAWHPAQQNIKDACQNAASFCQERGVDISRLALKFTVSQPGVATTLVSTASLANMQKNLASMATPLTLNEQKVLDDVMEKYMKPLKNQHWEGIEVSRYRTQIGEANVSGSK